MKYIDIKIGDRESISHIITQADIDKFVALTGDDNRLHVDEKFTKSTSFKKPVVHGMLGASFISTVIGTKLPGDGALWFSQSLDFLLPVRIGDQLKIVAEVVDKRDKDNIIELKTEIFNQHKQLVTTGVAKVKIIEQEINSKIKEEEKSTVIKTILVVGGTGGIGKATCIQLAKDGHDIIVQYFKDEDGASEIKNEIELLKRKAIIVNADVLNAEDIDAMIAKGLRAFGKIDAVVNCAAIYIPNKKWSDLEWDDYLKQLELNIKSTFSILKIVIPGMIERGYGKIINIGSSAVDKPNNSWSHYITAKAALVGLTRSLAFELAPKGIRINMVTPSMVDTELVADIPEKTKLITASQTPLRRLALPIDVANVISFLISDKSDFLSGENIRLNGGQIMI